MTDKPHISPSSLDLHSRCGEQYRRVKICGERIPPGIALIKGTSVHVAAETNFKSKIVTGSDMSEDKLCQIAVAAVDTRIQEEGISLTREEQTVGVAKVVGQLKDRSVGLTRLFAKEVAPTIRPASVEETVRVVIPESSHDLLGRLDLTSDQNEVVDFKTSGKTPNAATYERSDQFTFYDAAYEATRGRKAACVRVEGLIDLKTPKRVSIKIQRTPADRVVLVARMNAMLASLKAGIFLPAHPGHWVCSEKFCGFWSSCGYVNSERMAAEED
jgi:hypothetical protein